MTRPLFYSKFGKAYDIFDYLFEIVYYKHMRKFWVKPLRDQTILEIGVGTGKNLQYYDSSNTVIGIDIEKSMFQQAERRLQRRKNGKHIRLILQSGIDWDLPIDSFTTVIATFVFCTMENPKLVFDQLLKWTNPGTKLILFEFIFPKPAELTFSLKLVNPITKPLFGVDFSRRSTHTYLDDNWKLRKTTTIVPNLIVVHEIDRVSRKKVSY